MNPTRYATALVLAALLAACAGGASDATPPGETDPGNGVAPGAPDGSVPDELVEQILADAVERTGIGEQRIGVRAAEAVTWSDGSIGCPEPGMGYTQALVPGYRVILDVDGEELAYHASQDGRFLPCDDPQQPLPADE